MENSSHRQNSQYWFSIQASLWQMHFAFLQHQKMMLPFQEEMLQFLFERGYQFQTKFLQINSEKVSLLCITTFVSNSECLAFRGLCVYCKLVEGLDACLCLQLLPLISFFLGDATNGVASLYSSSTWQYYTYYIQII